MYSKEESRRLKKEFWTAFGVMMKPHISASGFKINWINYNTGIKDVHFRMDATNTEVTIAITLNHKDDGIRELYWEQFLEFRTLLHSTLNEEWSWEQNLFDDYGQPYSAILMSEEGNIYDQGQWPNMFAFLKSRLIALDEFWGDAQDIFKALQ